MAQNTLILRPVSDIFRIQDQGQHYPDNDDIPAYLLVNEVAADGDATAICCQGENGVNGSYTDAEYAFGLDLSALPTKIKITDINIYIVWNRDTSAYESAEIGAKIFIDGDEGVTCGTFSSQNEVTNYESAIISGALVKETINSYISKNKAIPPLYYSIFIGLSTGHEYKDSVRANVTQTYIELTYEDITDIGVRKKVNGNYTAATAAYQKIGGSWSEITEEDCKNILRNNTIRSG